MEVRHDDHDKNDELTCFTDSGVAYIYICRGSLILAFMYPTYNCGVPISSDGTSFNCQNKYIPKASTYLLGNWNPIKIGIPNSFPAMATSEPCRRKISPRLAIRGMDPGYPRCGEACLVFPGGIPMDPAFLMTTPAGHPNRLGRRISRPNNVPPFLFPAWGIPRSVSITRPIGEGLPGFVSRKVSILSSLVLVLVLLLEVLTSPSSIPVHLFLDTCHR